MVNNRFTKFRLITPATDLDLFIILPEDIVLFSVALLALCYLTQRITKFVSASNHENIFKLKFANQEHLEAKFRQLAVQRIEARERATALA